MFYTPFSDTGKMALISKVEAIGVSENKVDLQHFSICTEGFPYLNISKKPIQFVWERYQNHKFNCVCVFLVS